MKMKDQEITPAILKRLVRGDRKSFALKGLLEKGYPVTPEGFSEHREVYKKHHGPIPKRWVIHHVDCTKTNNEPDNLVALPTKFHLAIHREMKQEGRVFSRREVLQKLGDLQVEFSRRKLTLERLRKRKASKEDLAQAHNSMSELEYVRTNSVHRKQMVNFYRKKRAELQRELVKRKKETTPK